VIGGFHLSGTAFEPIIGPTCDAFAEFSPDYLVPAHCTGCARPRPPVAFEMALPLRCAMRKQAAHRPDTRRSSVAGVRGGRLSRLLPGGRRRHRGRRCRGSTTDGRRQRARLGSHSRGRARGRTRREAQQQIGQQDHFGDLGQVGIANIAMGCRIAVGQVRTAEQLHDAFLLR